MPIAHVIQKIAPDERVADYTYDLSLGDELLGRRGALISALHRHYEVQRRHDSLAHPSTSSG